MWHSLCIRSRNEEINYVNIEFEVKRGLPNFFNLVGSESPGLTASPAIGEYVAQLVHSESK
jgi:L-2-hydroxyglutarate oxidase LhgO